jgi:hypothetical protein
MCNVKLKGLDRGAVLFNYAVIQYLCTAYPSHTFSDDFPGHSKVDLMHFSDKELYLVETKSEKEAKLSANYKYKAFNLTRQKIKSMHIEHKLKKWLIHLAQLWHYGTMLKMTGLLNGYPSGCKLYYSLAFPKKHSDTMDEVVTQLSQSHQDISKNVKKEFSADDDTNVAIYSFLQSDVNAYFKKLNQI